MMRPRIADIITIASRLTEVSEADIVGRRRWLHLCAIRWPIYATARQWGYSYPVIGRILNRDHSSIIHSLSNRERFDSYIVDFDDFCVEVERLADELPPFVADSDWRPDHKFHVYMSDDARKERERVSRRLVKARKAKIAERLGIAVADVEPADLVKLDEIEKANARERQALALSSLSFTTPVRAAA